MARVTFFVLCPVMVWAIVLAIVDLRGFMSFPLALIGLLSAFLIPYAFGSVADALQERETRLGASRDGDATPLTFEVAGASASSSGLPVIMKRRGIDPGWLVVVVAAVAVVYSSVRIYGAIAGAGTDGLVFLGPLAVGALAIGISPSLLGNRKFAQAAAGLRARGSVWPAFRTAQFVAELRTSRPGTQITRDLMLVRSRDSIDIYTTERKPRLLLAMPSGDGTSIRVVPVTDRLGSVGVELARTVAGEAYVFDVIPRRTGPFTYFRVTETQAQRFADAIRGGGAHE